MLQCYNDYFDQDGIQHWSGKYEVKANYAERLTKKPKIEVDMMHETKQNAL